MRFSNSKWHGAATQLVVEIARGRCTGRQGRRIVLSDAAAEAALIACADLIARAYHNTRVEGGYDAKYLSVEPATQAIFDIAKPLGARLKDLAQAWTGDPTHPEWLAITG